MSTQPSTTAALKWANELNGDGNELLWLGLDVVAAKWTKSGHTQPSAQSATANGTTAAGLPGSSGVTGQPT